MDGNQVGGDWYDVLPLPDGAVGIAVGDVAGHDLRAAAAMGQLRGVVRSYAWDGDQPGSVLDRCDQLVQGLEMAAMATAVYARLDPPDPDGTRTLHYANAGRPTPLLTSRATTRMRTALLERTVAAVPPGSDAETVVDDVLAACLPDPLRDDVALLAVRLNP